jgi:hypothetical protein
MYKNKNSCYLSFKTHHKTRPESRESTGIDSKNLKTNYQNKVVLTKRIVLKKTNKFLLNILLWIAN